jgi:hypothetical protein
LVVKPWPDLGANAAPWLRGASGMSPTTFPVAGSSTMKWVLRETKTRPVPGSTEM